MKIVTCTCQHEYQDKKFGKNKRAANPMGTKSGGKYRCTVCAKVHE